MVRGSPRAFTFRESPNCKRRANTSSDFPSHPALVGANYLRRQNPVGRVLEPDKKDNLMNVSGPTLTQKTAITSASAWPKLAASRSTSNLMAFQPSSAGAVKGRDEWSQYTDRGR